MLISLQEDFFLVLLTPTQRRKKESAGLRGYVGPCVRQKQSVNMINVGRFCRDRAHFSTPGLTVASGGASGAR